MSYSEDPFFENEIIFEPEPEEAIALTSKKQLTKIKLVVKILRTIERSLAQVIEILDPSHSGSTYDRDTLANFDDNSEEIESGQIIEGVFNGESMVGADGQIYQIPENYASKSRLVEGDLLKLRITPNGSFVYKQIGPIDRERRIGQLAFDQASNHFVVICEDSFYRILSACVSYYHGEIGDQVVIVVPKNTPSTWAAVEHVLKKP